MIWFKSKKRGFTLAEVLIVCSIFAVMVIWIIFAINRAFLFMNNTRISVRASNFAREWVEMVYNIRDSNWRQQSWEKDKYRLNVWKRVDGKISEENTYISWWIYIIKEELTKENNWDYYVYAEYLTGNDDIYTLEWFFSGEDSQWRKDSMLNFSWTYSYFSWWVLYTWWKLEELLYADGLAFYRVLRVYGDYCKEKDGNCSSEGAPKEMRFCVKVFYELNWWKHQNELCSIMTNFME